MADIAVVPVLLYLHVDPIPSLVYGLTQPSRSAAVLLSDLLHTAGHNAASK